MTSYHGLWAIYLCWSVLLAAGSETDSHRLPRVLAKGPRLPIEVAIGGRTALSRLRHVLISQEAQNGVCKVEVDGSDCLSQTVGQIKPKIFDCFFDEGDVFYVHEGSPFINRDSVRLQVQYFFGKNNTIVVPVRLEVRINLSESAFMQRKLAFVGPVPLAVQGSQGRTQPIDSNAIRFAYDPQRESCTLEHRSERGTFRLWPLAGRLLNDLDQLVQEFRLDCLLFLLSAYKYQRTSTQPGLEFDYLPISVHVLRFGASASETQHQNIYLRIRLEPSSPAASLPLPRLRIGDSKRRYFEMPHSGGLPAILPTNLITANVSDLVVQVLKIDIFPASSLTVSIVDKREPGSMPLDGFELADLRSGNIALQVLGVATVDRVQLRLRLRPIDTMLRSGPEVSLLLISVIQHKRLQLFTSPMRVCTGGTALLRPHNLQSANWSENVRFRVKRDPYSGRLTMNGVPLRSFNSRRLARFWKFRIAYIHNGNLPRHDSIGLRAVFRGIRVSFKLPIRIVRNWNAASSLKSQIKYRVMPASSVCIGEEAINESALKYLLADGVQLRYHVTQQPAAGLIALSDLTQKSKPVEKNRSIDRFHLSDFLSRTICYVHDGHSSGQWDSLKIRQIGRPDLTELVIRILIQPKPNATLENKSIHPGAIPSLPETQRNGLLIDSKMLHYATAGLSPSQIGYEVLLQPHFTSAGANFSLDAGRLIDARRLLPSSSAIQEISTLTRFTQEDIDNGHLRYVPPLKDIGASGRPVDILLQPFDSYRNRALPHKLSLYIQPVDNMPPRLRICSGGMAPMFSIDRGDQVSFDENKLAVIDDDSGPERLDLMLVVGPRFGRLVQAGAALGVGQHFNVGRIRDKVIKYQHDGSLGSEDSFSIRATDGSNVGPRCTISINISQPLQLAELQKGDTSKHRRQQEQPQLEESVETNDGTGSVDFVNNTVLVPEGGQVRISPRMLQNVQSGRGRIRQTAYLVGTRPNRGEIALASSGGARSVSQFSQEDLSSGRVLYRHSGDEIGTEPVQDTCQLYIYNGAEWLTYKLNMSIRPVDNKGPTVSDGARLLIREAGRTVLTDNLIKVTDPDTKADALKLTVVEPPRYGEIRLRFPSGSETTVREFTKQQLMDGQISLVHTRHCGVEHTNDTFEVRASDGQRFSTVVPVWVVIFPVTDEPPHLRLFDISVRKGDSRVLDTSVLTISDADRPEEVVKLRIVDLPSVGTLYMHWLNTRTTEQVTEKANRNFTMVELRQSMRLVYKQDQDVTSLADSFIIEARDSVFRVVRKLRISIITSNELPPSLVEPTEKLQLRPGESAVVTERHLLVADRDTPKENLTLSIVQLPERAQLLLASSSKSQSRQSLINLMPLKLGDKITQQDVQLSRLFVRVPLQANNLEESSTETVVEQAQFVPEDGKFSASLARLEIKIMPIFLNPHQSKLQLVTSPTEVAIGSSVVLKETNIRVRIFAPQPPQATLHATRPNVSCWKLHKKMEELTRSSSGLATSEQVLLAADIVAGRIIFNASSCKEPIDFVIQLIATWGDQQASTNWFVRLLPPPPSVYPPRLLRQCPLTLLPHAARTLGPDNLLIMAAGSDPANSRTEPRYRLISPPAHGALIRSGMVDLGPDDTFSQSDLNASRVEYRSIDAPPGGRDTFVFSIDDSTVMRQVTDKTYTFIIIVQSVNKSETINPKILHASCPSELVGFSANRAGFRFTNRSLLAAPPTAVFCVTVQPNFGRLWLGDSPGVTEFAQSDVNAGRLTYRISGSSHSGEETIEDAFEVVARDADNDRRVTESKRIRLNWSVVGFNRRRYRLRCLSSGTLKLDVVRKGALDRPAFVRFETSAGTAVDRAYFTQITGSVLNFNPGESASQISIHIGQLRNDTKRAKLRISLESPGNCLLGGNSSTVLVLLNPNYRKRRSKTGGGSVQGASRSDSSCRVSSGLHFEPSRSNDMALFRRYLQYFARNRQLGDQPQEPSSEPEPKPGLGKNDKRPTVAEVSSSRGISVSDLRVPSGDELKRLAKEELRRGDKDVRGFPRCTVYLSGEQRADPRNGKKYICNGALWVTLASVLPSQSSADVVDSGGSTVQQQRYVDKPIKCPAGWTAMSSVSCVKYFRNRRTRTEAQTECSKFGAQLAELRNYEELRWVKRRLQSRKRYWIGLRRAGSSEAWLQPSGQTASFQPWLPNSKPGKGTGDCTLVYRNRWFKSADCGQNSAQHRLGRRRSRRSRRSRRRHGRRGRHHYLCQLLVGLAGGSRAERGDFYNRYITNKQRGQA